MEKIYEGNSLILRGLIIKNRKIKNNITVFYIQPKGSETVFFISDYRYYTLLLNKKTRLRTQTALLEAFGSCSKMKTYLKDFDVDSLRIPWSDLKKEIKKIEKRTKNFSEEAQQKEIESHYFKRVTQPFIALVKKYDSFCSEN